MDEDQEVTALLRGLSGGSEQSLGDVIPLVYGQLRAIAARQMAHEPAGHTLNPTAVVHEAFLRLQEINEIEWQSRGHFYAIASQAMRRVLVNYAVRRNTEKRGGRHRQVQLSDRLGLATEDAHGVLAVHQALERLEKLDARQVRVVECRFFSGLSIEETAEALGVSVATVKRDWAMARAWLNQALKDE